MDEFGNYEFVDEGSDQNGTWKTEYQTGPSGIVQTQYWSSNPNASGPNLADAALQKAGGDNGAFMGRIQEGLGNDGKDNAGITREDLKAYIDKGEGSKEDLNAARRVYEQIPEDAAEFSVVDLDVMSGDAKGGASGAKVFTSEDAYADSGDWTYVETRLDASGNMEYVQEGRDFTGSWQMDGSFGPSGMAYNSNWQPPTPSDSASGPSGSLSGPSGAAPSGASGPENAGKTSGASGTGYFNHGETVSEIVAGGGVDPDLADDVVVHKHNVDAGPNVNREDEIVRVLDLAIETAKTDKDKIDAVNLSQGALGATGGTEAIKAKIKELEDLGVPVIVAAGNNGQMYDETTSQAALDEYIGDYESHLAANPDVEADADYTKYKETGDKAALERFVEKNKLVDDDGIVVESVMDNGENRADSGTGNIRVNARDNKGDEGRQTSFAAPQLAPLVAKWKTEGLSVDEIKARLKEEADKNGGYFQGAPVENIFTELGLDTSVNPSGPKPSGPGTFA